MRVLTKQIRAGLLAAALAAPVAVYAQVTYPFDLPAQALADSLREFGSQARINVIFDPAAVSGRSVPALKGSYTSKQALAKLLEGTGYAAEFTDATTVVIKPQKPKPTPDKTRRADDKPVELPEAQSNSSSSKLDTVTVLGSLIPRAQIETASPLITITAEDIKNHGFSSVADALQNATVNTGAINNTAINTNDLWATKTISLFGLNSGYTKFLIDGRPMPPSSQIAMGAVDQLYTNLGGIPIDAVERIEILPGGQSSLYGSDAIAGVVNIVMKKHVKFGTLDARYGWYSDGGGRERMLSFTNSFDLGNLSLLVGAQLGDQQPMWAIQRAITAQNFAGGIYPQQPNADVYAVNLFTGKAQFPAKPSDCDAFTHLWGGSEGYVPYNGTGVCGSPNSGSYSVMITKSRTASLSVHANYAVNDNLQLYADLLDNYQEQAHQTVTEFVSLFQDANTKALMLLDRTFAPEEKANSLDAGLAQKNYENTSQITVGGKGDIGRGWNLDVAFSRSYERDDNRQTGFLGAGIPGSFGYAVLGPRLGTGISNFPIYAPNYTLMTQVLTPAQYSSYTAAASIYSTYRIDQTRAQLTQTSLFPLPGGDAGLAIVAEDGFESWKYLPAPLLASKQLQGLSFNPSDGHRSRYATAAELSLPVFKMLTADLSARYDSYDSGGAHFSKPTYSLGLEFRPLPNLLLRSKYSTSFKAPTLVDQFEGGSARQGFVADWANCGRLGFASLSKCPFPYNNNTLANVIQASSPDLQPLTAKTFSYGAVWSPGTHLSVSADYQHITIHNEVRGESSDYVLRSEWYCDNGTFDRSSPTCQAMNAQIVRAPAKPGSPLLGQILQVTTTKINVAQEVNDALNASFNYRTDPYAWGRLDFNLGYTRVLEHRQRQFPGDPEKNFLDSPGLSTEFQTKVNAALTWSRNRWSATLYGTYFGPTPNTIAQNTNTYTAQYAGKVAAWRIYNASINYSPTPAWQLSLRANNLKNSMPPIDVTYSGVGHFPFKTLNYNPYGREMFLEARYQFGRAKD